jgi:hypothetical protein
MPTSHRAPPRAIMEYPGRVRMTVRRASPGLWPPRAAKAPAVSINFADGFTGHAPD